MIRWTLPLSLILLPAIGVLADEAKTVPLTVQVADLRSDKGQLRLGVFDRAKGYPDQRDAALSWHSLPAQGDDASRSRVFDLQLPRGRYAIIVLHDENANQRLDTGFMGKPKESIGYSNNPRPKFRAATFGEAAFDLPEQGGQVRIDLIHP